MELQSKTTVYVAIGSMLALMGGIIYYASLDNESLEQAEIELGSVTLRDVNAVTNQAEFVVEFVVSNPSEKTFTVASIGYQLYGDGTLLGSGQYSVIDIALPGRAVFYSGAAVPLKSTFVLDKGSVGEDAYNAMIDGRISSFAAEGVLTTQTAWSTIDKEFKTLASAYTIEEKRDAAYEDFLTRNNKHMVRVSEYQKYWGDGQTDQRLNEILDNIRMEREKVNGFDPASAGAQQERQEFRGANDAAVAGLVSLLADEYDLHIRHAQDSGLSEIASSLEEQRETAVRITATSFPGTGDHVEMTTAHGEETEGLVMQMEEAGAQVRERHDVREVGDDQNTIQVLYSVITCQQELRINGEDYMDALVELGAR